MTPTHRNDSMAVTPTSEIEVALMRHARDCKFREQLEEQRERSDKKFSDLVAEIAENNAKLAALNATVKIAGAAVVLAVTIIGGLGVWAVKGIAAGNGRVAHESSIWIGTAHAATKDAGL